MKFLTLTVLLAGAVVAAPQNEPPLRLAIAGLTHGHVDGFFRAIRNRTDVRLVGVAEPDTALHEKYAAKYSLDRAIFGQRCCGHDRSREAGSGSGILEHVRSRRDRGSVRRS
jgi:hypothetical protein